MKDLTKTIRAFVAFFTFGSLVFQQILNKITSIFILTA